MKRLLRWAVILAMLGLAGYGLWKVRYVQAAATLPVAPAKLGEFAVIVRCRGELKAQRSAQVVAPVNVPELRIVWLADPGTVVKQGDVVVKFDPSSARQQLQDKEATLRQAQATLDQAEAQARITAEQDQLDLSKSKYDLERAKLEVSKAEIVSALQGETSRVDLKLAEQNLRVQQAAVALHAASDGAKIASLRRQRDQANDDVELTQHRLGQMELHSPLTGLFVLSSNYSQGWINAKPFKVGDQAFAGVTLAEIPDLNSIEMEGKVEEIDRGKLVLEQEARVKIDSLPEVTFPGRLGHLSPLTEQSFEWPPTRSFRGFARIEKADTRLRPGMNGSMDIVVNKLASAVSVPAKAVFTRQGKPVVYVSKGGGYEPVEVSVRARNPDEVAVEGVAAGTMVTLVEPDKTPEKLP